MTWRPARSFREFRHSIIRSGCARQLLFAASVRCNGPSENFSRDWWNWKAPCLTGEVAIPFPSLRTDQIDRERSERGGSPTVKEGSATLRGWRVGCSHHRQSLRYLE